MATEDAQRPGGLAPLENLLVDDMPWYSFWDDVSGGRLKTDKVNEARRVELDWLHHHGVYVRRKITECLQHQCAKPMRLFVGRNEKGAMM